MTDDELLDRYKLVAEFIAKCFSDTVEVVVHDVRGDLKHSVVCIFNNHISGRQPGAPLTPLATTFLKDKKYRDETFICNYEGVTINGVAVRASTHFIRNEKGKLIGFLCANVDVGSYAHAAKILEKLVTFGTVACGRESSGGKPDIREDFPHTASSLAGQIISEYCLRNGKLNDGLSSEDKYAIIAQMEKSGVFAFKGSIGDVAAGLKLSEPTIYRYLKKVRKENRHA